MQLLKFESSLPIDGETANGMVGELLDHYAREKEPLVRCKVISVLGELARLPGFNTEIVVDNLIASCQSERKFMFKETCIRNINKYKKYKH